MAASTHKGKKNIKTNEIAYKKYRFIGYNIVVEY